MGAIVCATATSAHAATFYVRSNGSDQSAGTSAATAFASIARAAQELGQLTSNPGDRVVVGPGTYREANIVPGRNGVAGHPIVFLADVTGGLTGDPPGAVTINVRVTAGQPNSAFIIYGKKYIVVDGFTITGATDPAIQIRPDPVSMVQADAIVISNNTIRGGDKSAIDVQTTESVTIRGNRLQDNDGSGIVVRGPKGGDLVIDENVLSDNSASGILVEDVSGGSIADNQIRSSGGSGILVRGSDSLLLKQNTLELNGGEAICAGCGFDANAAVRDIGIESNTVQANRRIGIHLIGGGTLAVSDNQVNAGLIGMLVATDEQANVSIEANVVTSAQEDGIVVRQRALNAPLPTPALLAVRSNTVLQSQGRGISLGLSSEPLALRVEASNNRSDQNATGGIEIFTQANVQAVDNVADSNGRGSGLSIVLAGPAARAEMARNRCRSNGAHGIFLSAAAMASIDGNTADDNGINGILVRASSALAVSGNTVRNNADGGIGVGIGERLLGDCDHDGNVSMGDLIFATEIVLGEHAPTACGGVSRDGVPDVSDLVAAVNVAISGLQPGELGKDADISDNIVERNGRFGIVGAARGELTAQGNSLRDNATVGLSLTADAQGDLVVRSNMVLDSGADGVLLSGGLQTTLDMNRIDTSGGSGARIREAGALTITQNRIFKSSESGLLATGSGAAIVTANTIEDQLGGGIVLTAAGQLQLRGNSLENSGGIGISVGTDASSIVSVQDNQVAKSNGDGLLLSGGVRLAATNNRITTSTDNGIRIVQGGELTLNQNRISASGKSGVLAVSAGAVAATENTITSSGAVGISLQALVTKRLTVTMARNQISGSTAGGVVIEGSVGGNVADNTVAASAADGITIRASSGVTLSGNRLSASSGHGIVIGSDSAPSADAVLTGNQVNSSSDSGINLFGSKDSRILDNTVLDSGTAGVAVRMSGPRATTTITGNTIGRSGVDGLAASGTVRALVQNNVLFSNGEAGIVLRGARNSSVINNLVYANQRFGVAIGTGDSVTVASPDAVVASNTIYRNGEFGVVIGTAVTGTMGQVLPPSPGALVVNNAFQSNGFLMPRVCKENPTVPCREHSDCATVGGICLTDQSAGVSVAASSLRGFVMAFNFNPDGYGDGIRVSPYDRQVEPGFVDPDGADNRLGGTGYTDDDFHLQRTPEEQRSVAIDAGSGAADEIGISGSCLAGAGRDSGVIDVCYHYMAASDQVVHVSVPDLPQFLFVRKTGDAQNDGLSPQRPFASIFDAGERAAPGTTIVIGPGRYNEGDLHVRNNVSGVTFLADPNGTVSGDAPGPVIIDPSGCQRCRETTSGTVCLDCEDTGFVLVGTPDTTIDGFHITGAKQAAIQIRGGADGAVIRNNIVFSNRRRGIEAFIGSLPDPLPSPIDAPDIRNNLIYANGTGGIRISQSSNATVLNNTVYGNGFGGEMSDGILIGGGEEDPIPTRGVVLMRNVVQGNADVGIRVQRNAREGYVSGYNVSLGLNNPLVGYAGDTPRADSDFLADALLVNPPGDDGILGGAGFADDDFRLRQSSSQLSPAVDIDFGEVNSLSNGSTSSDGVPDRGPADAGYHYPLTNADQGVTP